MKTTISVIRYILGILLGLAAYFLGFYVAGIIAWFLTKFQLFNPAGTVLTVSYTAAAIVSNIAGFFVFRIVAGIKDESAKKAIPFAVIQIVLAILYGALSGLMIGYSMIDFMVVSIIVNAVLIHHTIP